MSTTKILTITTCGRCAKTHESRTESTSVHGIMPEAPPFWLVGFSPPGQTEMISFRQWVCDTCAKELGGPALAAQLAEATQRRG